MAKLTIYYNEKSVRYKTDSLSIIIDVKSFSETALKELYNQFQNAALGTPRNVSKPYSYGAKGVCTVLPDRIEAPCNRITLYILRDFINADPKRVAAVHPESPRVDLLKQLLETAKIIKTPTPEMLNKSASATEPQIKPATASNSLYRFLGNALTGAKGAAYTVATLSGLHAAPDSLEDDEKSAKNNK